LLNLFLSSYLTANIEHNNHKVLPVPVGLYNSALLPFQTAYAHLFINYFWI